MLSLVFTYIDTFKNKFDIVILNQRNIPIFFIKDCWAVKDIVFGYGDTYECLEDALQEYTEEDLNKGFCIKDEEDNLEEVFTFWESRGAALSEISENLKEIIG